MQESKKHRIKVLIVLAVEFIAIAVMLILIFFAGKKSYTVTFDLNGGTLLSGDTVQVVTQGQSANPPKAVKEGCYFLHWSGSYSQVTRDLTIKAVWEYETTEGIEYETSDNKTYCEIVGCYKELSGDVYIGAYHNDKKVLGIKEGAFKNCENITSIYLLDGILAIEDGAFEGCTSLTKIEMPTTLVRLGDGAFKNCTALESITLYENLKSLGSDAFAGCVSLQEAYLPSSLKTVGSKAFDTATAIIYTPIAEKPVGWAADWCLNNPTVVWSYVEEETDEEIEKE